MDCTISDEILWSWVDQESPALEEHLATCASCRERAERMRAQIATLANDTDFPTALLPGRIGAYTVRRLIGGGGQGVVYEAEQHDPQRVVALKVLRSGPCADEQEVRRFRQEIQALATLRHPSIATIYEAGQTELGCHYFAMEFIRGVPIDEYGRTRELPLREKLTLVRQVCQAVQYAHEHGVVHRDLKPGNILIDAEGAPRILDFGLARISGPDSTRTATVTRTGQVLGTPRYMSPEQTRGRPEQVDARSDIYSLGVILYELISGQMPYCADQPWPEAMRTICEATPRPLGALQRAWRGDLENVVLKALEKEPARRYPSAAVLSAEISRYLNGEPVLAKPASGLHRLRKRLVKNRWRLGLAIGAILLVAVGIWAGTSWARLASRQEQARANGATAAEGMMDRELARRATLAALQGINLTTDPDQVARQAKQAGVIALGRPDLPEAALVWLAGSFKDHYRWGSLEETRGVLLLTTQRARSGPSAWAFTALLADMHRVLGETEAAAAEQEQADRAAPDTAEAWYLRAFATLDVATARRYAQMAVDRGESSEPALVLLSGLCLCTGELDCALTCARRLEELTAEHGKWAAFQGNVLLFQGRYGEASELFTQLSAEAPADSLGPRQLALARLCIGDLEGALTALDRSLANEDIAWTHRQRATVLWMLGRLDEAASEYRETQRRIGRDYADVRLFLIQCDQARLLRQGGQRELAGERLQQARAEFDQERKNAPGAWRELICMCIAGEISPAELVSRADKYGLEGECEAHYYAGERCLLDEHLPAARAYFGWCVEHPLPLDPDVFPPDPMSEYHLARWRFQELGTEQSPSASAGED